MMKRLFLLVALVLPAQVLAEPEAQATSSEAAETPAGESEAAAAPTAAPTKAAAQAAFRARQTAHLLAAGESQWGIFGPYYRGLKGGYELELRPLVFTLMASPNFILRKGVKKTGLWTIAAEGGLSVPTLGMKMWQGGEETLLPLPVSIYGRADVIPWIIAPRLGMLASRGTTDADVLTLRADLTIALKLTDGEFTANDHWLLGLLFAPVNTGYRARLGAAYDRPLSPRLRLRSSLDLYLHGAQPDQARVLGKIAVELAAWKSKSGHWRRVGLGVGWLNSDTYGVNEARERVRSNDVLPLLDIVF